MQIINPIIGYNLDRGCILEDIHVENWLIEPGHFSHLTKERNSQLQITALLSGRSLRVKPVLGLNNGRYRLNRGTPVENPDAYVAAQDGWSKELVQTLRTAVCAVPDLEEKIKWGHLVYMHNGPVLLIRAEENRVLFGFWRGSRLTEIEPRLKKGGKYEMATLEFREGDTIKPTTVRRLVSAAQSLNQELGDPTKVAKTAVKSGTPAKKKSK